MKLMEGVPMSKNFHTQIPRGVEMEVDVEDFERMKNIEKALLVDLPKFDRELYVIAIFRYFVSLSVSRTAKELRITRERASMAVNHRLLPWLEKRLNLVGEGKCYGNEKVGERISYHDNESTP